MKRSSWQELQQEDDAVVEVENDCENLEHNFCEESTLGDDGSLDDDGVVSDDDNDEGSGGEATTFDDEDDDESSPEKVLFERILPYQVNRSTDSSEDMALLQRSSLSPRTTEFTTAAASVTGGINRSGSSGTLSKLPHNQRAASIASSSRQQRDHARSLPEASATRSTPDSKERLQQQHPGLHYRHQHRASYENGQQQASLIFRNSNAFDDDDDDVDIELAVKYENGNQESLLPLKQKQRGSGSIKTASTKSTASATTTSPRASRNNGAGRLDLILVEASEHEPGTNLELPFWESLKDRGGWLVGLLVLQSTSSFVISRNEQLLQDHIVIVQFLTMLVGAGGNAGNQASVRVIRGLAVGSVNDANVREYLLDEMKMAVTMASVLGVAGCIRAAVFLVPARETFAITTSLWLIVFFSIVLGSLLPLAMKHVNIDPAHSSTTIQVLMDILGVTITVQVCSFILANSSSMGLPSMAST